MIRKILLGSALLLVVCVGAYVHFHHTNTPLGIAYAGSRQLTLWSTTAQVRKPVTIVSYGDRLDILQRFQDQVQVRTAAKATGWVNERDLLSADLWQKAKDLEAKAATLPVQARGHTKVLSNLHIEPGRDTPRLRQLGKGTPVDFLARIPLEVPAIPVKGGDDDAAGEAPEAKREDWWLLRAHTQDDTTLSGWIVGRFIELEVPSPLPDYASASGMRIVGWYPLSRVTDDRGNPKVQYLVVGVHGPEGQPCDFTMLRVFTWGAQRQRYETAFVESNVCGKLPVKLTQSHVSKGVADVIFSFEDRSHGAPEDRAYRMHQTVVRRIRQAGAASPRKPAAPQAK
ncbi:MAG: hypothetical protein WBP79_03110 [Candidatus Acidiferrales bacterium]